MLLPKTLLQWKKIESEETFKNGWDWFLENWNLTEHYKDNHKFEAHEDSFEKQFNESGGQSQDSALKEKYYQP